MLEKLKGVIDVPKLRAMVMLEADLNALNKILSNGRVMLTIEKKQRITYEIIGVRRCH